jgi:predicted lysophospholipase L1 biosynthesis ABC-type transport system permease subunit
VTPRALIIAAFALILVVAIAVDLRARRADAVVRPLGATLAAALRTRGGRVVVLGAWLWLGWHFLAR